MTFCRVDSVPWIPGCCLVGDTGLGVAGASVPVGAFGRLDIQAADSARSVRWLLDSLPRAGELFPLEDSSFSFIGAPPGTYDFRVTPYLDGVALAAKDVVINVNITPPALGVTIDLI